MTGSANSPPAISWNPVRSFATSLKRTRFLHSDPDLEGASTLGLKHRSGPLFFLLALPWVLVMLVMVAIAAIAAIASASLLLSFVGITLLGLTRTSGEVYTNVTVVSLVVATVCGAATITAAGAALVLIFLPMPICCGGGKVGAVSLACSVAFSGGIGATFFAPAIGIAITRSHIIGLSAEFTAKAAMRMNGVGLGAVLACGLAQLILYGVLGCIATPINLVDMAA
ncbi:hypothetical protein V8D89_010418 [Ganoderma adspersum]